MNNKTLIVGLIISSLLIMALLTRNGDIAWMMLPFLAYLGIGILQTPALDKVRLNAERTLEQTRSNGLAAVAVNLTLQNQALETVHLIIEETIQEDMEIMEGELRRWVSLQKSMCLNTCACRLKKTAGR